jgi:hypothetical protein
LAGHLDAGLSELKEQERDALLLRYFEKKSAHEMAQILGITDEAAQKRVSRAVEQLRQFLTRRGVTAGAGALVVAISAHAVEAAPAGLGQTISAATATAATASIHTAISLTTPKIIAMTTLQKTLFAAIIIAAVGTGVYQARQTSQARQQAQAAQQNQIVLSQQIEQLQRERNEATNRLTATQAELARLEAAQNPNEVLRLRGQVGTLRQQLATTEAKSNAPGSGFAKMMSDPAMREYINQAMVDLVKRRYSPLFQELKLTPEQTDQFIQLVSAEIKQGAQRLVTSEHRGDLAQSNSSIADDKSGLGQKLKELLGDSGAARFAEYSQELPARTTVDLLDSQLGGGKLNEEQRTRLFQVVKAEPFELTHGITGDLDKTFFASQPEVDGYLAKISDSNQRVLQQAGEFLTSEQLAALNTVLANGITARVTQAAAFTQKH